MKSIKKQSIEKYNAIEQYVKEHHFKGARDTKDLRTCDFGNYNLGSHNCPYCKKYAKDYTGCCSGCPLLTINWCCDGLYVKMAYAQTWRTFLKYLRLVRQYIEEHG